MKRQDFDRLIAQIRDDNASEDVVDNAADRVRAAIFVSPGAADAGHRLRSCADFQSLFSAHVKALLTPARRLLMEDHLHQCVACRRALEAAHREAVPVAARRSTQTRRRPVLEWALAAALAAGIVIGIFAGKAGLPRNHATVASVDGEAFAVGTAGNRLIRTGFELAEGNEFRTGKASRALVQLGDGSEIELGERSQLSISAGWRGTTIHLDGGDIIVRAAHRRTGHLYVSTGDCLVTSKGTVFVVNHGTKGSRVSVLEGAVNVAYGSHHEELIAGGQVTSNGNVSKVPIRDDLAWSRNAAKYLTLVGEFRELQKQWEQIPGPGLRYRSHLLDYLPNDTVLYAAIPNIGSSLGEASRLFEDRLDQSPVLREWWTQRAGSQTGELEDAVSKLETFASYLGDEVVVAVAKNRIESYSAPVILADLRRPGLREFLEAQNQELSGRGEEARFQVVDARRLALRSPRPALVVYLANNLMVASPDPAELQRAVARIGQPSGAFEKSAFYQQITNSYRDGAGWLFAVDMEQILRSHVKDLRGRKEVPPGFENLNYLVIEQRDLGKTETRALITLAPGRKGIAAWLAEPAPMGSLDFVSPEASVAASFVIQDPKTVVDELFQFARSREPNFDEHLAQFESALGVSVRDDISAPLGGEVTFALDGPVAPVPSWKVIAEVYDPGTLQSTISKLIDSFNRQAPPDEGKLRLTERELGSQTYFTLRDDKRPAFEIDYAFVDSYWIMAPSQPLVARAIQNRQAGYVLARSPGFQAQLPTDGYTNFSAVFYHNLAPTIAPLEEQLKKLGALNPEQQRELSALGENSAPGLVYAYREPDRIVVSSTSGFLGLGLDTLLGIGEGGSLFWPELQANKAARERALARGLRGPGGGVR